MLHLPLRITAISFSWIAGDKFGNEIELLVNSCSSPRLNKRMLRLNIYYLFRLGSLLIKMIVGSCWFILIYRWWRIWFFFCPVSCELYSVSLITSCFWKIILNGSKGVLNMISISIFLYKEIIEVSCFQFFN